MEPNRKRHCWECRRRRLVCDSTLPRCKRCSSAGTACPGYDDAKPSSLKWLVPGRVTSRNRRTKAAPAPTDDDPEDAYGYNQETARMAAELVLRRWSQGDVAVPRFEMRTEICDLVQAVEYFNTYIYQDLVPLHELGYNPYVYPIMPMHIQNGAAFPDHMRFSMVCITLSHRINRTRDDARYGALAESFYRYRGIVIRSLREDLNSEKRRTGDVVLAGVLTLLLADAQQGALPSWRSHLEGIQSLIALRGGIRILSGTKGLEALVTCFVYIGVIGNTTSPASDLSMTGWHLEELDFILERYGGGISAFQLCPPSLFGEIIRINHLRMRAATNHDPTGANHLSQEAYVILHRIDAFSPELWAQSKLSSKQDWSLLANTYHAAAALYCISSLQSLCVLPPSSPVLRARCAAHAQHLQAYLAEALQSPRIKRFALWPLVVLGVEAVHAGPATRSFVARQLPELSRYVGSYVPLMAKGVLERFWRSGGTGWDDCFDRPYAFALQIAVDVSRISPPDPLLDK